MGPRHPGGLRSVRLSPLSRVAVGSHHSEYLPQTQMGARRPGGLRSVTVLPHSKTAGAASIVGNCRGLRWDLAILGGCDL
eukprot:5746161-Pyramimonas_sp.AAC.1